jgi:uncharacterized Zn finger protein (UPF0148 family)
MNTDTCERCGGELEWYDGESYCPSCTYWTAVDEAVRALNLDHGELPEPDPELPY